MSPAPISIRSPPHVGRGGWTWYTGSAGWMYRAGLELILGFRLQGAKLLLDPCIPTTWPSFGILFRYRSARYDIRVENPHGVSRGIVRAELDGVALPGHRAQIHCPMTVRPIAYGLSSDDHLRRILYARSAATTQSAALLKGKNVVRKVSPLAGKMIEPSMLVNVPRLVTAYFTGNRTRRFRRC